MLEQQIFFILFKQKIHKTGHLINVLAFYEIDTDKSNNITIKLRFLLKSKNNIISSCDNATNESHE